MSDKYNVELKKPEESNETTVSLTFGHIEVHLGQWM